MLKITKANYVKDFKIECTFNNQKCKIFNAKPFIEKQIHLNGVNNLLNETEFLKFRIGEFGELLWKDIYINPKNEKFDYDFSPEFVYEN